MNLINGVLIESYDAFSAQHFAFLNSALQNNDAAANFSNAFREKVSSYHNNNTNARAFMFFHSNFAHNVEYFTPRPGVAKIDINNWSPVRLSILNSLEAGQKLFCRLALSPGTQQASGFPNIPILDKYFFITA